MRKHLCGWKYLIIISSQNILYVWYVGLAHEIVSVVKIYAPENECIVYKISDIVRV